MEDTKKTQKIYSLAPSEFNFLMKCHHCYWKKHNEKLQNKGTFPGVFSLFDMRQKEYFNTLKTKDITPSLPDGDVYKVINDKFLKSKVLYDNKKRPFRLQGRADLILKLNETGSYAVIDNKTATYDQRCEGYFTQLEAYAVMLENPEEGYPKLGPITHLGLHYFTPGAIKSHTDKTISQEFKRTWHAFDRNTALLFEEVTAALDILHKEHCPAPDCSGKCDLYISALNEIENLKGGVERV